MSTISAVKSWSSNEVLTASDLNSEFSNLITNSNSLNSDNLDMTANYTWTGNLEAAAITATSAFLPDASGGANIGSASLEFGDLYLADTKTIYFGNDQDITLAHVADTGVTLAGAHANGTNLQLNNTATDGDSVIQFALSGTVAYSLGVEDGDSDKFVINYGTGALGAAPALEIDGSGNTTVAGTLASTGAATLASLVCTAGATFGGGYGATGTTISTAGVLQTNGAATFGSTLSTSGAATLASLVCTAGATFGGGTGSSGATITTAGAGTFDGIIKTEDTTEATSTTDGSLQTDGGLSVAKDAIFGDDLKLLSDSAVLALGEGDDATLTHDGTTGVTIAANPIIIDSGGNLTMDAHTGIHIFKDAGTEVLRFTESSSGQVTVKLATDGKNLVFTDNGDATNMTILDAAAGINVPGEVQTTKIAYTDGDDAITIADGGGVTTAGTLATTGAATLASLVCTAGATFGGGYGSAGTTIDTDGVIQTNGAVTLGSTLAAGATTITGDTIVGNGYSLVVGNSAQIATDVTPELQYLGTANDDTRAVWGRWSNDAVGSQLQFLKSRNTSIGSQTIVQDDDQLGRITSYADDGNDNTHHSTIISFEVDGTPGENDVPGRIVLSTTADGAPSSTERMRITSAGLVGIAMTPGGSHKLDVTGSAGLSTGTAWTNTSDSRIKTNVQTITGALAEINKLRPISFRYTDQYLSVHDEIDGSKTYHSFIADEYETVFPNAVSTQGDLIKVTPAVLYDRDDDIPDDKSIGDVKTAEISETLLTDLKQFTPHDLNMFLVAAVQELSAKVAVLEAA